MHVRVNGIGFPAVARHVFPQGPGLCSFLFSFLLQPGGLDLRLLSIGPGTGRADLVFAGIQFNVLRLLADFGCLLPVRFVALLLNRLTALPRQQQHNKRHHHNANNHPNPQCCIQSYLPLSTSLRPDPCSAGTAGAPDPFELI